MKLPFFGRGKWDIENVNPPWGNRTSIYQHILTNIRPGEPGLGETGERLPDEDIIRAGKELAWAPGALDGVMGHHGGSGEAAEIGNQIFEAFRMLTKEATDQRAAALYSLLLAHSSLSYADHLLETVVAHNELDFEKIHRIAHWLATGAADREPVKCAIALLGVFPGGADRDLLMTLGRHDEFTLFAAVALTNSDPDAEMSLWALACLVTGWGRIQIIERLAKTQDAQIKAWLLREGYANDVLLEYTALICARTGDLLTALRQPEPDDKLLKGAGAILTALIAGSDGPVEGIEAYEDGAEATELYLTHLQSRDLDLQGFIDVSRIDEFVKDEKSTSTPGWVERNTRLLGLAQAILSRPDWERRIGEDLKSADQKTFWTATEAARLLGIDAWDIYFERLTRGENLWHFVMQTDDHQRIDRVIQFAKKTLPLSEIASGPADTIGLGPMFASHSALDSILQSLGKFPGKGWTLIRTGLQSPTVRNRNMAVQALAAWDRSTWPVEAEPLLRHAIESEPRDDTRAIMQKALAGDN